MRLESSFKSFIKSTIDCCQLSFSLWPSAIFLIIASTSAGVIALPVAGAPPAVAVPWAGASGAPGAPGANGVAPGAFLPKIAEAMLPKMLMIYPPSVNSFTAVAHVARDNWLCNGTERYHALIVRSVATPRSEGQPIGADSIVRGESGYPPILSVKADMPALQLGAITGPEQV